MGRPGQDTDFLLEHVPQFGQVGADVGVRDECDGEAAGLQAVRNISRSTGRVVGIEAREQFKEMTGTSATWWRRASAASPTRSASSTRSSKTPLNARATPIGAVATGLERARIDGGKARTPPVKSRWPGTEGGRVPRPSIGSHVERAGSLYSAADPPKRRSVGSPPWVIPPSTGADGSRAVEVGVS